ncbi:hypothetical protein [Actinomadura gamaensis]|uniref:IrrE N-terminal-like domain-containing protein n=1 Tax=Actinomadura gamaensis TaxID=1763541 RepID=A0ABV9UAI1_9ACTN
MLRIASFLLKASERTANLCRLSGIEDRCRRSIRELQLAGVVPRPFDIDEMVGRLAMHRRRPVRLEEIEAEKASRFLLCGLLVQTVTSDHIMFARGTTPLHREHIIAHEIGHIIFEHGEGVSSIDLGMTLLPDVDPRLIKRMLGRFAYSSTEEREAETFASLLVEGARRLPSHTETSQRRPAPAIAQVEQAWGDMRRLLP